MGHSSHSSKLSKPFSREGQTDLLKLRIETTANATIRRIKEHSGRSSHIVELHPLHEKQCRKEEIPKAGQQDTQPYKLRRNRHAHRWKCRCRRIR